MEIYGKCNMFSSQKETMHVLHKMCSKRKPNNNAELSGIIFVQVHVYKSLFGVNML